jgi:pre-mRNA 3'-end-processing factor FIP1
MPNYNGQPINKIDMQSDLLPSDKPWRKPGADVTDYFNYGFDEFTWTAYCEKQAGLREEFSQAKMAEQFMFTAMNLGIMPGPGMDPSQMGDMSMMGGFGMQPGQAGPGGPAVPSQGPGAQPGMQGMDMMGDPSMYGMGGQGFDGRGQQEGAYGMGRGGMYGYNNRSNYY